MHHIYEMTCGEDKEKDWYRTFGKIKDVYKKTMTPRWFEGKYFLKGKVCFICLQDEHRIDFDCHTLYRLHYQTKT